jgi:adenylate cyclase
MDESDQAANEGRADTPAGADHDGARRRIVLAHEAPIRFGALSIEPALRRVAHEDGREAIVEPRVMQVLVALVRAGGRVLTRDDLLMSCWHGVVVGEDAIDRVMSRLRRLADGVGGGEFKLETITKVGYRLVPADPRAQAALSASPSSVEPRAPAAPEVDPLLAVLAFDNLSGDADLAWFSDGVSEEILQTVARGADLKVIGRGSSFQFRGADKAAAQVAAALKATHVLDGSVRRSGSTVRIAAHLIECAGETTLWSARFDRELSDVFALQDEIAAAVAAALKIAFAPAAKAETIDPEAYNLYLKALEMRNRGLLAAATLPAVIELLEEATVLAPNFARAWVFLATMRAERLRFDETDQPYAILRAEVLIAAETALRLDPGLGGAHQALGQLEPFGHFAEREAFHERALSVAPNDPTVLTNASLFFAEVGRVHEALGYARQAYDLDPMYPWAANWYGTLLHYAGRNEGRRVFWESLRALWPENELIAWGAICSAASYGDWGWFDDLVQATRDRRFDTPTLREAIGWGRAMREPGPEIQARALKRAQDTLTRTGGLPLGTFMTLYGLGLTDEVFELADQASFAFMFDPDQRSPNGADGPALIFSVTINTGMMRDVRFVGLCGKLGLVDYWVKSGRWPDCAEAVAPYYDFKARARRLAA